MFTTGRIIFAIAFVIVFSTLIFFMYRKDFKMHKMHYKGSTLIFITFAFFIGLLFAIKLFLKD